MSLETEKEKTEVISQPYEYFDAQVSFAKKISEITGKNLENCMFEYTDLYNSLTNKPYGEEEEKGNYLSLWKKYIATIQGITDSKEISDLTYELFLKQDYSREMISENQGTNIFGCFKIDYSDYNQKRKQIRLHFSPTRLDILKNDNEERYGDLSTKYISKRKDEFRDMIKYIHDNINLFKGAKYLKSHTWLQNIPNYQNLFPGKYSLEENRVKKDNSFLGLWGQFVKWDLTGNKEVYERFKENLEKANTLEECVNAFPYPVYEIQVPLEELFKMYDVE